MFDKLKHLFTPHHSNNHKPKLLHHTSLAILISLLIFSQSLLSLGQLVYPHILGFASQIPPQEVISLSNQVRQEKNLPVLKFNPKLADAARRKAADMFADNYWSHTAPDGIQPWSFIIAAEYNYLHAGENLARDFKNPQTVVKAWMASPTHRANLLNPQYQDIGIAVVDGRLQGKETTLVVQMLGTPQTSSPQVASGQTSIIPPAQAQETQAQKPQPTPTPTPPKPAEFSQPRPATFTAGIASLLNPFSLSKVISLSFALLVLIVLLVDWYIAYRKNLIRLSGRNWAHVGFIGVIIILVIILQQGLIL